MSFFLIFLCSHSCANQKLPYICIAFEKQSNNVLKTIRALSSAGSERLPYKQRVGGSNPSAPTKPYNENCEAFLFPNRAFVVTLPSI